LRCIGYNPLHYIPQRTYSRLIKENNPVVTAQKSIKTCVKICNQGGSSPIFSRIDHLDYLEAVETNKPTSLEQEFNQVALRSRA
jgi:hypothetical protein